MQQSDSMDQQITDDRKGSLTLRANHMNYSRAVLNSNWHQARQAEPKDYDLNSHPIRTLAYSTYKRIGCETDGYIPETSYQEQAQQIYLKGMYAERDTYRPMVQPETLTSAHAGIDRNTGDPKDMQGSVLPYHRPEHNRMYLDTTYNSDYVSPYPFIGESKEKPKASADTQNDEFLARTAAYKKMKSQFTDTADYRRNGWNTWQDESGIYTNSHDKAQVFPKTQTIPERSN